MTAVAGGCIGTSGKIFAFEPDPILFDRLLQNVDLNRLAHATCVRAAIGSHDHKANVYRFDHINIGRASLVHAAGGIASGEVDVTTLDSVFDHFGLKQARVVKIDVEGFEAEVVAGASKILKKGAVDIFCIECDQHMPRPSSDRSLENMDDMLSSAGYKRFRLLKSKFSHETKLLPLDDIAEVPQHDNAIYIARDVVSEPKIISLMRF